MPPTVPTERRPRNQDAMDGFARMIAGVTSPAEFLSPENAGRIISQAAGRAG